MIRSLALAAAAAGTLAATPALAQNRTGVANPSPAAAAALNSSTQPDVLLDIPNLSVEQITLEVDNLQAHIALDARLGNLLKLTAGADASIDKVKLDIKGVKAQATLIVRLDNVRAIIERTLQTIDNNPAIIQTLGSTVNNTVGTVGGVVNNTVNTVGNLTTGLLRSGAVLDIARSGLSTVSSTVDAAGNTVRRLRASDGAVYEVVTDTANKILRSAKVG
ncbi:hypothetical protein ACOYW6_10485 [Parablastomonas sp. CN1-191]|uniref:hypothetical protein n=1 Tax=Parablastomonas sp. CN1-191 TaxID=3400908 RepID=UPI003BF8DDA6